MEESLPARIRTMAQELAPRMTELRRDFHRCPELSEQEYLTTAKLKALLAETGIAELDLGLATGLVGVIHGSAPGSGKTLAIRADIDALPIQEQTGLAYASEQPGRMHACGHDLHAAALWGAGVILGQLREHFTGTVRLLFQPAEETLSGARLVIAAGAMQGVDAVIGGHCNPDLPVGQIGLKSGALMASSDLFSITVTGRGGHAALPQHTADPITAGAAIISALQTVVSRNIDPLETAVLSVGSFHAGHTHNVIPAEARMEGTYRAFDPAVRAQIFARLNAVATNVAAALGASARVEHQGGIAPVLNDPALTALLQAAAEKIVPPAQVVAVKPSTGSEDFSEYGVYAPQSYVWWGCARPDAASPPWHHPGYNPSEEVLPLAAAFFAQAALDYLRAE